MDRKTRKFWLAAAAMVVLSPLLVPWGIGREVRQVWRIRRGLEVADPEVEAGHPRWLRLDLFRHRGDEALFLLVTAPAIAAYRVLELLVSPLRLIEQLSERQS